MAYVDRYIAVAMVVPGSRSQSIGGGKEHMPTVRSVMSCTYVAQQAQLSCHSPVIEILYPQTIPPQ